MPSRRDPMGSLQESVDRMTEAFERMSSKLEGIEANGAAVPDGDRFTRHIRRYMPFYALATVWALMLLLLPTRQTTQVAEQAGEVTAGGPAESFDGSTGGSVAAGSANAPGSSGGSAPTASYSGVKTTVGPADRSPPDSTR